MAIVDSGELFKKAQVQQDSTEFLLQARKGTHGDFTDDARIAQELLRTLGNQAGWLVLTDVQIQALQMICTKIARILAGDPHHADHWDDIAGYAKLVSQRLPSHKSDVSAESS